MNKLTEKRNEYRIRVHGSTGTFFGTLYATKEQHDEFLDMLFESRFSAVSETVKSNETE